MVSSPTVKVDVKEELEDTTGPAKHPSTQNQSNSNSNINNERSATGEPCSDSQDEHGDRKDDHPPAGEGVSRQELSHPRPSGQDPSLPSQVPELFPEPRIPYPCFSRLTSKDQLTYLHVLTSKQPREASQVGYQLALNITNTIHLYTIQTEKLLVHIMLSTLLYAFVTLWMFLLGQSL